MCIHHIPSPQDNATTKVEHIYTGPQDTELAAAMHSCDPDVSSSQCNVMFCDVFTDYIYGATKI